MLRPGLLSYLLLLMGLGPRAALRIVPLHKLRGLQFSCRLAFTWLFVDHQVGLHLVVLLIVGVFSVFVPCRPTLGLAPFVLNSFFWLVEVLMRGVPAKLSETFP